jgi:hypothetical protein
MVGKTYTKPGFMKQPGSESLQGKYYHRVWPDSCASAVVSSAFAIFGHGSSTYPRNESKCHACGVKIGKQLEKLLNMLSTSADEDFLQVVALLWSAMIVTVSQAHANHPCKRHC